MTNFEKAMVLILDLEGGKSDRPEDSGKRTAYGITQRTYNAWRDHVKLPRQDVFEITMDEVRDIYEFMYWSPAGCERMDLRLAICHFQASVVMGVAGAKRILDMTSDGMFTTYLMLQMEAFRHIVAVRPKDQANLKGWLNRVNKTLAFVRAMTSQEKTNG